MRYSAALSSAAVIGAAVAAPQGVTQDIAPSSPPPAGCSETYDGTFEITIGTAPKAKRDLEERATCGSTAGALIVTLKDGNLLDAQKRTGYIAANYQFQFDGPAQTGAIYTSGFSVCQDGSLALGGSKDWYRCLSGDFYNLYDRSWAPQCEKVSILIMPCTGSSGAGGAPGGPMVSTTIVSQIGDGQVQAIPTMVPKPITQIGDGQIQAPTGAPVTQIADGQVQAPPPVATPVTQISDGQVQAPTGAPVTQIGDGQVQAPTGAPVTQISDGQIQAPTGTPKPPVTQISDGQIQAPTGPPVTQISDGQIQAPGTVAPPASTSKPPSIPISGASPAAGSFGALVLGLVAAVFAL